MAVRFRIFGTPQTNLRAQNKIEIQKLKTIFDENSTLKTFSYETLNFREDQ